MEENIEYDGNFDKIKVFSSEDEKLKLLGELLSNKSSRDIIRLLIDKEMYINEIVNKLDMRRTLVIHHLKKMESIGLLQIQNKEIVKKGNKHRYFRVIPNLFVSPNNTYENIKKKGILKKIFHDGVKFTLFAAVGIFSWITYTDILFNDKEVDFRFSENEYLWNFADLPISIPIGIIILSLTIFLIIKKRK